MSDITIVDYGVGNLFNVQRAFKSLGVNSIISRDPSEIQNCKKLLLPGVGAFNTGMEHLKEYGLIQPIKAVASSGRPILGICLGMQLLMTQSEENGLIDGLDLIPGRVVRFSPAKDSPLFKIPQIGWNSLEIPAGEKVTFWQNTVLSGIEKNSFMYFIHSYYVAPKDKKFVLAESEYGANIFCSAVHKNNIWGCQFHPERSGEAGLRVLKNFAAI